MVKVSFEVMVLKEMSVTDMLSLELACSRMSCRNSFCSGFFAVAGASLLVGCEGNVRIERVIERDFPTFAFFPIDFRGFCNFPTDSLELHVVDEGERRLVGLGNERSAFFDAVFCGWRSILAQKVLAGAKNLRFRSTLVYNLFPKQKR